ncbi:GPW/gp25 family protein [Roseivirga sp. BDSF3-8]|uniref:GPW/gp25 family protein n=1 Tax=Roseivirga sp. BDSF3-8 TaxID=3241598 RepID=UPI003531C91D
MKHKKTFLGVGWKFPPTFEKNTGSVMLVSEEEDIRESLRILLSTRKGERVMLPDYGCDLSFAAFDTIDSALFSRIRSAIEYAILYYEPRIILENINIRRDKDHDGLLLVDIEYIIRKTNKRTNMVYPYYILEGSEARYKPL